MRRSALIRILTVALVLTAAPGRMTAQTSVIITGVLVDSACYLSMGSKATSPDHLKCAMACAQKSQRLALVTSKGDVYFITGLYTQQANAKLIPLLNTVVAATGTVTVSTLAVAPAPLTATSDNRRPISNQDTIVVNTIKTGDIKEGDSQGTTETTIEIISIKAVPTLQ